MTVVGDIIRATLIGNNVGDLVVNTWHFEVDTLPGAPSDFSIINDLQAVIRDAYVPLAPNTTVNLDWERFDYQNVTTDVLMGSLNTAVAMNGTSVQDPLPNEIAAYVWWRTLKPKVRASKYIAGLTEGNASGSSWSAGILSTLQDFADYFVGQLPGVLNTYRLVAYNPEFKTFNRVVSAHVTPKTRIQRRRRPGYGS